ncbi:epithelial-stromal interaction protein 1 isoform X2 [Dermochelys coriacea]|uniref:epithelial-stromal interaction protein 1 isoform X2 n=1 Tax=Dermochelys coriacea TaxID=27794 RepID=UPI0018E84DDF|nr:epithelial-stromal interaction protein 1 isoform X2 [Dermochelys coriacea]
MYVATGWEKDSRCKVAAASTTSYSRGYQEQENSGLTEGAGNPRGDLTSVEELGCQKPTLQHTSAYVLIPPNETRRNQIQKIANKELENLERWKEQHRPGPINLKPQKLGGTESEAEARQKQHIRLLQSKYQQKADKLEEKRRKQEKQRREMFNEDHYFKTTELLDRLDLGLPKRNSYQMANPSPESTAWTRSHTYKQSLQEDENRRLQEMKAEQQRKGELLELRREQEEQERIKVRQNEQRRVNNAFLDRLQSKSQPSGIHQSSHFENMDHFACDSWHSRYFE